MGAKNYIIIAVLVAIAISVTVYLLRAKRRGEKCVGCPYARQCRGKCDSENSKHH